MKKSSKILVLALCVALLLCGAVLAVNAADGNVCKIGNTEYASISEAVEAAEEGATIQLIANAEISETIDITKDLTIDLNGKTLSNTVDAFTVATDGVSFTITGRGYINSSSSIVYATGNTNVAITGTNQGIVVKHEGSKVLTAEDTSTVRITNAYVRTASKADAAYFALSDNARFFGNKLNFESTFSTTAYNCAAFSLNNGIYISLKDSSIRTNGAAFVGAPGYSAYRDDSIKNLPGYAEIEGKAVELDNVNVTAGRAVIFFNDTITNYFSYENDNADSTTATNSGEGSAMFGTFTVKGGSLSASYRTFVCNFSQDNITATKNFSVSITGATINAFTAYKQNGTKYERDGYLFIRKNMNITFDDCRILVDSAQLANGGGSVKDNAGNAMAVMNDPLTGGVILKAGTRLSQKPDASKFNYAYEDGSLGANSTTYEIVFDATGDREFPWVVIEKGTATVVPYKQYFMPIYNLYGEYFDSYNTQDEYYKEIVGQNGMKVKEVESFTVETDNNKGSYGKYTLYSDKYAYGDLAKMTDFPSSSSDGKWDSFYAIGSTTSSSHSNSLPLSNSKVIVYNISFSAGTEWGYVNADLYCSFRGTYTNPEGANKTTLKIENNVIYDANNKSKSMELDPFTWYNLTILLDVENNVSSFYIDGELFASGQVYKTYSDDAYFQGLRFGPHRSVNQVMGSSLIFDNVSGAAYNTAIRNGTSLDTSKYVDLDNSGKKVTLSGETGSAAPFKANGIYYSEIDNALKQGTVILTESNAKATKLTEDGYIFSNGYVLKVTDDSDAMLSSGNASDIFGVLFTVDESLNDLTLDIYWYVGGSLGDKSDLNNQNGTNYIKTTVKPGQTPMFTGGTVAKSFNRTTSTVGTFSGKFALAENAVEAINLQPISLNEIMYYLDNGEFLTYYAHYDYEPLDFEITNSTNASYYNGGIGGDELYDAINTLKDGDTVKLLNDVEISGKGRIKFFRTDIQAPADVAIDDDYSADDLAKLKEISYDIAIDLAGHTLDWTGNSDSIMYIGSNINLSIYSSEKGGQINKLGFLNSGAFKNNRAFAISTNTGGETWGAYNAHINIGEYNGMYKGNLTTATGILAEGLSGDSSCSINAIGGTFVRATADSAGLFLLRCYNGALNIKDATCIVSTGSFIEVKSNASFYSNLPSEWAIKRIQQSILVEDSYIFVAVNGNKISANTYTAYDNNGTVTQTKTVYRNCFTNASLSAGSASEPAQVGSVVDTPYVDGINYNVFTTNALTTAGVDGSIYKEAKANISITLPGGVDYIEYPTAILKDGAVVCGKGYVKINGATVPDAESTYQRKLTLNEFYNVAIAPESETVTVVFNDSQGNALTAAETYVKGGNVIYSGPAIADVIDANKIYKEVHNGEWSSPLANIQTDTTFTPITDKVLNVDGFKLALSLYSEFSINLYIPAAYVDNGFIVSTGDHTALTNKITIGTEEYYVLTQWVKPYEVTRDFTFSLGFMDGDFEDECTFTYSVLEYSKAILEDSTSSFTAEDKSLIWYILNYANETYKYIAVNHTPYADEIAAVTKVLSDNASKKIAHSAYTYADKIADLALGDVFEGATVMLSSAPKFVFVLNDDFVGEITVSYAKKDATTATLTFTEADAIDINGDKCIVIEGMKAYEFLGDLTVSANGTIDGTAATVTEAKYNLDTFASYHIANAADGSSATQAESQKSLDLINAFYAYAVEATSYAS